MKSLAEHYADKQQLSVHAAVRGSACPAGTRPFVHAWRKLAACRESHPQRALDAMRHPFPLPSRSELVRADLPSRLSAWDLSVSHARSVREVLQALLASSLPCLMSSVHQYCAETGTCAACGDAVTVQPGAGVLLSTLVDEVRLCFKGDEWAQCPEAMQCLVEDVACSLIGQPSTRKGKDLLWGHVALSTRPQKVPQKRPRKEQDFILCI